MQTWFSLIKSFSHNKNSILLILTNRSVIMINSAWLCNFTVHYLGEDDNCLLVQVAAHASFTT